MLASNGGSPGEHLEHHAGERVDVGRRVHRLAARLLGAHVERRAEDRRQAPSPRGSRSSVSPAAVERAMPKSATSAMPSAIRMFSGLMSRCTSSW